MGDENKCRHIPSFQMGYRAHKLALADMLVTETGWSIPKIVEHLARGNPGDQLLAAVARTLFRMRPNGNDRKVEDDLSVEAREILWPEETTDA